MAGRPATLEDENVFEVAIEESTSCKVFSEQRRLKTNNRGFVLSALLRLHRRLRRTPRSSTDSPLLLTGEPLGRAYATGALDPGHEEAVHVILIRAAKPAGVGMQGQIDRRDRGRKQAPDRRLIRPIEFDAAGVAGSRKRQSRQDVLHPAGVITAIEGQKKTVRFVPRRDGRPGLKT